MAGEREAFLEKYETIQPVQYGTVMKEYVQVPAGLLVKTGEAPFWRGFQGFLAPLGMTLCGRL